MRMAAAVLKARTPAPPEGSGCAMVGVSLPHSIQKQKMARITSGCVV